MSVEFRLLRPVSLIALTAAAVFAAEAPVDLSGLVNQPWTFSGSNSGLINGNTFPAGDQNFGGIPFSIPAGPNNYWSSATAANFAAGTVSLVIPVGVFGVTSAFTLMNSVWGQPGPDSYVTVTFTAEDGSTDVESLIGGVNIRDYNQDGYQNTINNTSTIQAWTNNLGQRLDRQEYILPSNFANQVLTSVTITDSGNQFSSRVAFAALTVSACTCVVTEGVTATSDPVVYHPSFGLYTQHAFLTNTTGAAIPGPVYLILEGLPSGVRPLLPPKTTTCFAPVGSPYRVAVPAGSSLAPGATARVRLAFVDPSATPITYTPLVVNSRGGTP